MCFKEKIKEVLSTNTLKNEVLRYEIEIEHWSKINVTTYDVEHEIHTMCWNKC